MASEHYDFAHLGTQIADALERAAEDQFVEAQNNLDQVRKFAHALRSRIAATAQELTDLHTRLRQFGKTVVDAQREFYAGEDRNSNTEPRA